MEKKAEEQSQEFPIWRMTWVFSAWRGRESTDWEMQKLGWNPISCVALAKPYLQSKARYLIGLVGPTEAKHVEMNWGS